MSSLADATYLFHHTPPVDLGPEPELLVCGTNGRVVRTSLDGLTQGTKPIVTHSFSLLVDWYRRSNIPLPSSVIDLELAKKLAVGQPKSAFDRDKPWDMWPLFQSAISERYDASQVRASLGTHMSMPAATDFANLRWMVPACSSMPTLWKSLLEELTEKGEDQRFLEVEVPAYNAMLGVQYSGIAIDTEARDSFLLDVDSQYVRAHHELSVKRGVNVDAAVADIDYLSAVLDLPPADVDDRRRAQDVIAMLRKRNDVCGLLHEVVTAKRNESILLRTFSVTSELCHPIFDTMGTVTGRILTIDPGLQHLRKRYRSVIAARDGYSLVYADYSQFEPCIMASISGAPSLKELCADRDLYTFESNRPRNFSFLVRPTQEELNDFVLTLDKMMSDNINKEFFMEEVPDETEQERTDGKIVVRLRGTIAMLKDWFSLKFRPNDPKPMEEMIVAFKQVRKLRQKPAHAFKPDIFDQSFFHQQCDLVVTAYNAVRTVRLVLANHPLVRSADIKISDALCEGKIWAQ